VNVTPARAAAAYQNKRENAALVTHFFQNWQKRFRSFTESL
jgi:hypothetical protein